MEIKHREFLNVSTRTCHASTLVFYKDQPIYAWFGGSREGMPDCAIYIQCGDKLHSIGRKDELPRWNPILFEYKDELFLFVKIGTFCDRWQSILYNISDIFNDDFNIDKIIPQVLPAGLNGPVKTKPVVCGEKVYCGSSVETIMDWSSYVEVFSVKGGKFIFENRSAPLTVQKQIYTDKYYGKKAYTLGIIQPSLWVDKNEKINSFFRSSNGLGKIYYSQNLSKKNNSWTIPIPTDFNNPNSGIDTVFTNGRLFLAYNPYVDTRSPLLLSELDEQFNIKETLIICTSVDKKDVTYSSELSYPYLVEHNGSLYLSYTYGRSKIDLVNINI